SSAARRHVLRSIILTASCASPSRTGTTSARPKLYAIGDDFGAIFLLAIFSFPAACLHAAFYKHRTPLFQILVDGVCLSTEDDDIVKICLLLFLAIAIFVCAIGRY